MQKQITLLGRSYTLRADEGDEVELAAADLERRLQELGRRAPAFDSTALAVLAALNLAAELRALRLRVRMELGEAERQLAAAETVMEAALSGHTEGEA